MAYLACTRFNNLTYDENTEYRNKHGEKVIYGSPLKIREIYPIGGLLFIAEMNTETNQIEGIGLIRNQLVHDRRHHIYDNSEYNRYIYKGNYWLSRKQIGDYDTDILDILDIVLFKGKSHLKRRIGITIITEQLFVHWNYNLYELKHKVKQMFLYYFTSTDYTELNIEEESIPQKCKTK
jgi:hypothetical protein